MTASSTISSLSFAAIGLNIVLCILLPLGLVAILLWRRKISIRPVLVGLGVFLVFQLILRLSVVMPLLATVPAYLALMQNPWFSGLFLGLTAGLFEELGRVLGFNTLLKNNRSWWDGVAFGLGHGGIEAIVVSGLTSLNNLLLMVSINNGSYDQLMAQATDGAGVSTGQIQYVYDQLVNAAPLDFLLSGIERVFALIIQVALTLLVLYALQRHKAGYVVLAIALHTLVDAPLGILPSYGWNIYMLEGYVALCAVVAAVYIACSYKVFARLPMTLVGDAPPPAPAPEPPVDEA